jgi:DnaJ domain
MSGSVSGKFQDHYSLLGVEPRADSETIQEAYSKLAEKYNPNNPGTGDPEKFEAVNLAFEVLSDPTLRAGFDKLKGIDHEASNPKFSGVQFFHALEHGAVLRSAVLCVLYDRRRIKSSRPSLSMRNLESMLHVTPEELNFAMWYLKQRGLVINDDKSSLEITVDGMDYLERNHPSVEAVMPLIKVDALTNAQPEKPRVIDGKTESKTEGKIESKIGETKIGAPVLNALNRARQRKTIAEQAQAPLVQTAT